MWFSTNCISLSKPTSLWAVHIPCNARLISIDSSTGVANACVYHMCYEHTRCIHDTNTGVAHACVYDMCYERTRCVHDSSTGVHTRACMIGDMSTQDVFMIVAPAHISMLARDVLRAHEMHLCCYAHANTAVIEGTMGVGICTCVYVCVRVCVCVCIYVCMYLCMCMYIYIYMYVYIYI